MNKIIFFSLIFLSISYAQYENNLITNGNFDSDLTGWKNLGNPEIREWVSSAHGLTGAMHIKTDTINYGATMNGLANFSLVSGQKYRFKASVYNVYNYLNGVKITITLTITQRVKFISDSGLLQINEDFTAKNTGNTAYVWTYKSTSYPITLEWYVDNLYIGRKIDTLYVLSIGSDADNDTVKTLTEAFVNRGAHSGGVFIVEARDYGESITIDSSFSEIVLTGNGTFKTTKIDFNNKSMIIPYDLWIGTAQKLNYDNVIIKIDAKAFLKYRKRRWGSWNNN